MCGIAGYLTTAPSPELLSLMLNAFVAIQERGSHASGIAVNNNGIALLKQGLPAKELIKTTRFGELWGASQAILHTRYATSGSAKDNKNNHPFRIDNLVWVHNGIIYNAESLKKQHKFDYASECDSYIIGALINRCIKRELANNRKVNMNAILKSILPQLKGYYAIAIMYENKIYLVNGGSTLYLASFGDAVIFASGKEYIFGNDVILPHQDECFIEDGDIVEIHIGPDEVLTEWTTFKYKPYAFEEDVEKTSGKTRQLWPNLQKRGLAVDIINWSDYREVDTFSEEGGR